MPGSRGTYAGPATPVRVKNTDTDPVPVTGVIGDLVPGTGPTNLGKAEDNAHASGDVGVMALAVRADVSAPTAANGDYHPLLVDNLGKLRVTGGTSPTSVTVTPTITAGAYSAKDAVGGRLEFANAVQSAGGSGRISKVVVTDKAAQSAELVLALFNQAFTATADNAPFDPTDADLANYIGHINLYSANYVAFNDNGGCTVYNIDFPFVLSGTTTLYGQLMCTGTPTYASTSDLTVKLTIDQA